MWLLIPPCNFPSSTQAQVQVAHQIFLINLAGPYVTSVGATTEIPEVGTSFSGGGFSENFPSLAYQKDQVNDFISSMGDKYFDRFSCVRSYGLI